MTLVRVYNRNYDQDTGEKFDYEETFKGKKIHIKCGEFVVMEHGEAVDFLGTLNVVTRDADGNPDKKSRKKLYIEPHDEQTEAPKKPLASEHKCQACGYEGISKADLESHIDENHLDQLADGELADERRKKGKK